MARQWASDCRVPCTVFHADWDAHGKAAGPKRNRWMLDTFKPDAVIAFAGGRGTSDCIQAATQRNIPLHDFRGTV
jgi:hypothetical protein